MTIIILIALGFGLLLGAALVGAVLAVINKQVRVMDVVHTALWLIVVLILIATRT